MNFFVIMEMFLEHNFYEQDKEKIRKDKNSPLAFLKSLGLEENVNCTVVVVKKKIIKQFIFG